VELNDPELEPLPQGDARILDDAELQPIAADVEQLGAPKGPIVQAYEAAAKGAAERGDDVKLIWIVLPVAAAGFYILTRRRQAPAAGPAAAPGVQDSDDSPAGGRADYGRATDPGAAAGSAHAGIIDASWTRADLAALVNRICQDEGYPRPELVHAIVAVESGWNPNAVNMADHAPFDQVDEGDSAGLMQLKVRTAQAFEPTAETVQQLLDPVLNVTAGVRFLAALERKWGATEGLVGVIQMYNLGETRYRAGERNRAYAARVQTKISSYNLTGRT
jgi:hypothetical protein